MKLPTEVTWASVTVRAPKRIGATMWGWKTPRRCWMIIPAITWNRKILIAPVDDPVQPPTNVRAKNKVAANAPHIR